MAAKPKFIRKNIKAQNQPAAKPKFIRKNIKAENQPNEIAMVIIITYIIVALILFSWWNNPYDTNAWPYLLWVPVVTMGKILNDEIFK